MISFLTKAFEAVSGKLGGIAVFIPAIAERIRVAIKSRDVEKVKKGVASLRARNVELREVCDGIDDFCDYADAAVADGQLDGIEMGRAGLKLEKIVDEAEDVLRGYDEDD
jgi:hypothetical protein